MHDVLAFLMPRGSSFCFVVVVVVVGVVVVVVVGATFNQTWHYRVDHKVGQFFFKGVKN
jgi:hypothetical protein